MYLVKSLLVGLFMWCTFTNTGYAQGAMAQTHEEAIVAGIAPDRLDRYTNFLNEEIEQGRLAGAEALIFRKGEIVQHEALGYKNLADKSKMEKDQIFYIQSMTKPIITVAFMMLYEEGHFLLTDPVAKYIPQFDSLRVSTHPNNGAEGETEPINQPITISQLLSHTAGFSHGLGGSQLDRDIMQALYFQAQGSIESRVKTLLNLPLIGQPGQQWYYSASPDVLALLIEKFSGMSAAQFLQARIFDPLDMNSTGYNVAAPDWARVTSLHQFNDDGKLITSERQTPAEGNVVFGGTHGLFSTASDYLKFCKMLLNDGEGNGQQLLSRKTIELMTENHVGDLYSPGQGFGLGFGVTTDISDSKALGSVGQYYWSGAFCTYFFIDPKEDLISILMTQTAPYTNYYGNKMRQFVYQAIVD